MFKTFIVLTALFAAMNAYGAAPVDHYTGKEFVLNYELPDDTHSRLQLRRPADTFLEATASAASECARHFSAEKGGRLTETQKLDIVDACTNPRP